MAVTCSTEKMEVYRYMFALPVDGPDRETKNNDCTCSPRRGEHTGIHGALLDWSRTTSLRSLHDRHCEKPRRLSIGGILLRVRTEKVVHIQPMMDHRSADAQKQTVIPTFHKFKSLFLTTSRYPRPTKTNCHYNHV
jgi:hypothetical protein